MSQSEPESTADDFEVEVSALAGAGDPARRWQPWPSRATARRWLLALRRRWRWASMGSVLLVVTLSLAGNIQQPPLPGPLPPPVLLMIQPGGIDCLRAIAWSPDSSRTAFLGYRQGCPGQSYQPGVLNIYSAVSGRLLRQVQPDRPILQAFQRLSANAASSSGSALSLTIDYASLLWSPRSRRLALTFTISPLLTTTPSPLLPVAGVLLLDDAGQPQRVLLQPIQPFIFEFEGYLEWDMQRGLLLSAASTPVSEFSSSFPVSSRYRWGADGALIPEDALSLDTPPPPPPIGPVGNPSGDASFTIWQPGTAQLTTQVGELTENPGVFTWGTAFAAWSPDGRYLLDGLDLTGRVQPAGIAPPSQQTLVAFGIDQAPILPIRDAAFGGLLRLLPEVSAAELQTLQLAWRPDGRVLAAYGYPANMGQTVNLYDCVTGRLLASLSQPVIGGGISLSWSPDGSRLLWVDGFTVIIWGPGWLPRW